MKEMSVGLSCRSHGRLAKLMYGMAVALGQIRRHHYCGMEGCCNAVVDVSQGSNREERKDLRE